jgi:hypothetical protein
MSEVSRRNFVMGASLGVVAAAAAPTLVGLGGASLPKAEAAPAPVDAGGATIPSGGPVVAHLLDADSGKVAVYQGSREVIINDPALVRALAAALA